MEFGKQLDRADGAAAGSVPGGSGKFPFIAIVDEIQLIEAGFKFINPFS